MNVRRYSSPRELARDAMPMLLRNEAINNWTIGFLSDYSTGSRLAANEELTLLGIEDDAGVLIASAVSTGESLVLTPMPDPAIAALLAYVQREQIVQPKTSGPAETVSAFARLWAARRKAAARVNLRLRIMRLTQVRPPPATSGSFRPATMDDVETLARWSEAFDGELGFEVRDGRPVVTKRIELNRLFVWCDPHPVSMAGIAGPTPNGMRVNFVYTPRENRCRGYARSCVARVSQRLLDSGKAFVFLYVDAENPTTNRLYSAIGYEAVCDWEDWKLDA